MPGKTDPRELERQRRIRDAREKSGSCMKCGKGPPTAGFKYCQPCREKMVVDAKAYQRRLRRKVIDVYGGKCVCCGEATYEFLTLDHKYNDGAEHRRELNANGGTTMLRWIVRNGYPDRIQVLCWNCNAARQYHGRCPHHG